MTKKHYIKAAKIIARDFYLYDDAGKTGKALQKAFKEFLKMTIPGLIRLNLMNTSLER